MNYPLIADLPRAPRTEFTTIVLLTKCIAQQTSSGGEMLRLEFGDRTGSFGAVLFNNHRQFAELRAAETGSVWMVQGLSDFYEGCFSPKLLTFDRVRETPEVVERVVALPPEPLGALETEFQAAVDSIEDPSIRNSVTSIMQPLWARFREAPAGERVHHAYRGGLLTHTVGVIRLANAALPLYPRLKLRRDLVVAGLLLHDCCKLNEYTAGLAPRFSIGGLLSSHIADVFHLWVTTATHHQVAPNLIKEIGHILLSHHGEKEYGSPVTPHTPEAWFVCKVDDFDAQMGKTEGALNEKPNAAVTRRSPFCGELVRASAVPCN